MMQPDTRNAVGLGMVAGVVGTAVMALSETVEMRITGREPSDVPGQVGSRLTGMENTEALTRAVHWARGALGGAARGLIGLSGANGPGAAAAHFAATWGSDAAIYRALGIAEAPWKWECQDLVVDMFHKGLYAAVTGAVYEKLSR